MKRPKLHNNIPAGSRYHANMSIHTKPPEPLLSNRLLLRFHSTCLTEAARHIYRRLNLIGKTPSISKVRYIFSEVFPIFEVYIYP